MLALVPPPEAVHAMPATHCSHSYGSFSAAGHERGAQPNVPSRDRRLALAVEALETGARDDVDAVSAKVDTLRLKAKGQMRTKLDGLRKRLDAALERPPRRRRSCTATGARSQSRKGRAKAEGGRGQGAGEGKASAKAPKAPAKGAGAKAPRPPGQGVERDEGAEEAVEGRRRRQRQRYGRVHDVLWSLRAARRRQGEQQARPVARVGDLRRVGQDVAKTLPVGSRVEATVLSVDATKGFRVALSTKRQRKTAPKPIFEEEKAPVAKA